MPDEKIQSRRPNLQEISSRDCDHAGLWLDKFIDRKSEEKAEWLLVHQVASIGDPQIYTQFFENWKKNLKNADASYAEAEVKGRLAINLGDESVLETSIALHQTYGVPYIPGSALKGLAAHYAHNFLEGWDEKSDNYKVLFGTKDEAGYIIFYDALYIPKSGFGKKALHPDIITVHHPEYYQGAEKPPADWDNPTPINFLSATGKYLIALGGDEDWRLVAFKILDLALKELGVGAKTSSGYGRMELAQDYLPPKEILWYDGIVVKYSSRNKHGIIRSEDGEFLFKDEALYKKGWAPPKKQKVRFARYKGENKVLKVEKRWK